MQAPRSYEGRISPTRAVRSRGVSAFWLSQYRNRLREIWARLGFLPRLPGGLSLGGFTVVWARWSQRPVFVLPCGVVGCGMPDAPRSARPRQSRSRDPTCPSAGGRPARDLRVERDEVVVHAVQHGHGDDGDRARQHRRSGRRQSCARARGGARPWLAVARAGHPSN